jgi:hypothetical protein
MAIILTYAVLSLIAALGVLLAIVRTGVRRQERSRCLACQPPGLAAALTRRITGLSVRGPIRGSCYAGHVHDGKSDASRLLPGHDTPPAPLRARSAGEARV